MESFGELIRKHRRGKGLPLRKIENELEPLAKEFTDYRKENKLWEGKFDYMTYETDAKDNFYRMPFVGSPAVA